MRIFCLVSLLALSFNASSNELLWDKLEKDPNMIVLMRNSESAGNKDGSNMLVWDASGNCKGESLLTDSGKAHANRIGKAFTLHGIKPKVISSPMCRCTATAKIAFGDHITDPLLQQSSASDTELQDAFQRKTRELLIKHRGKTPVVFINHRPNIDALTMELLNLGEMLVGVINETGEIEVLGKIKIE